MIITLRNLTVQRSGNITALDSVSCVLDFHVSPRIAVIGANGAGKSTLLAAILNLVPASSGSILINETPNTAMKQRELRTRIGMIFQNADNQLFSQTVWEDIAFGPAHLNLPAEEIDARVNEVLNSLAITGLAQRSVTSLSGGEKRRVALAGVLAMRPELILLDEPTAMLDPRGIRELAGYLRNIPSFQLIATHDLAFAAKLCDNALILRDGKLFAFAPLQTLLADTSLLTESGLL